MAVRSAPEQACPPSLPEAVLDLIGEAVFVVDRLGRLRHVNRSACQLFDYSRVELLALSVGDFDLSLAAAAWTRYLDAVRGGDCGPAPHLCRTRAGRPLQLQVTASRCEFEGEECVLLVAQEPAGADRGLQESMEVQAREFISLMENVRSTIVRWDRDSRVVYMNRAWEQALDIAPGTGVGTRLLDETGPEWLARLREKFVDVLRTMEPGEADLKIWHGPSLRVEHVRLMPVRAAGGAPDGVLMIGQEATERFLDETVLRESARHYRDIFENSPDGLYMIEVTESGRFRIADMNPALSAYVGLPAEEIIGCYVDEALPEAIASALIAKYRRCVAAGQRIEEDFLLELPTGSAWYHSTLMPLRDQAGRIHRIVGMTRDITERKRMEDALRESESRYRDIFDNTLEGILLVEVIGARRFRMLDINAAFELSTGVMREESSSGLLDEVLPESLAGVLIGICQRALGSGTIYQEEAVLDLPIGTRLFNATVIPVVDESGRIHRLIAIIHDITEKREMEAALEKREQAFRSLAENLPDNVVRYDRQGIVTYANPMMCETLGVTLEALLGRGLDGMPDTDWGRRFKEIILGGTSGGAPEEVKITLPNAAGEARTHLVRFVTERDETGAIAGTLSIGRDITEMERAAMLLHARAEAFRAVVENSPDTIARYDREGRRIFLNPAMARLFDRPVEEILGSDIMVDSPMPDEPGYVETIREALRLGEEVQGHFRYLTRDGEMRWGDLRVVPEFGPDGAVVSVLAVGRDVTGLKETQRRLEESRAELRELAARRETAREEERKRIAREMHDELGQLLMALRLEITVAEHHAGEGSPVKEKIARTMGLLDRTSRVVRQMVADLRPAALDMGLASALEWLAGDFMARTGVGCELRVEERDLHLDEARSIALFRIVQESLTNVARHAHATRVTITLERRDGSYRLEVRDDGRGFDRAGLPKDSFGLVGVRERAMALGGTAVVHSAPGAGTTVEVIIPEQDVTEKTQ